MLELVETIVKTESVTQLGRFRPFRLDERIEQKQILSCFSVKKLDKIFINIDLCRDSYSFQPQ